MNSACGGTEGFPGNIVFYLGQQSWLWGRKGGEDGKGGYFSLVHKFEREFESWECSAKAISWWSLHRKEKREKEKKKCFVRKDSGCWKLNTGKHEKNVTPHFEWESSVAQLCLGRDGIIQSSVGIHVARHMWPVSKRRGKQFPAAGLNWLSSITGKLLFGGVC